MSTSDDRWDGKTFVSSLGGNRTVDRRIGTNGWPPLSAALEQFRRSGLAGYQSECRWSTRQH